MQSPHICQLSSSAPDKLNSALSQGRPGFASLISSRSNSIIHKKSLRFLREIKVAYTCLYSINEMIDMLLHYTVKTKTQLFVLVK